MDELNEKLGIVVGTLFMSRTFGHTAHLKTQSFAAHKALDDFYSGIVDITDKLAEAAQGTIGLLNIPVVEQTGNVDEPLAGLKEHIIKMEQLMQECNIGFINNIFEEIQAHYASVIYKLTNLK